MDRNFEKSIREFKDLARFLPLKKTLPLVESQIKDFIKKCNSSDPIEDIEIFEKAVTREHYQKRINFFKNWLLENGYRFDERRGKVLALSEEDRKRKILRTAFLRLSYRKS